MLQLNYIRNHSQQVIERLKVKNFDAAPLVERILQADKLKREILHKLETHQSRMNAIAREIGNYFKSGEREKADSLKEESVSLKDEIKILSEQLKSLDEELDQILIQLPNIPHQLVPVGKSAENNQLIRSGGIIPKLADNSNLTHWELGQKYNILNFDLGNKLTGSGFPVFISKGAKLQRALISFFLDEGLKQGYTEILPPLMVNEDTGYGTGQLPDKEGQMYRLTDDPYYLIPTAEVPVTNIYRDVIIDAEELPVKNMAYTPCFRREAGSYGADVRGLNRVHQFDKVEIVHIEHPEKSYDALEGMVAYVESLVVKLGLPYRILRLCGGDISFTSAMTYDFEVYSAAQKKWLEVSSVSNFEAFQANRLKLRFRSKTDKKTQLAHTLNGSALALPRIVAAILENNQTSEGIRIPEVLLDYTGFGIIS